MQKISFIILLFLGSGVMAQTGKPKPQPVKKPLANAPLFKNQADSFSYAIGVSIANFYKEQGITNINTMLVTKAIGDCRDNKSKLDDNQVNNIIMAYMQEKRREKSAVVRKAGEAFLAENKKKPGVVTTASGLQYTIITEGTGPRPAVTDRVKVHYHGTLIDGTIFDSSVDRGQPYITAVNAVIQGWVEALQLMPVGSKWRLFIPSDLAYGDNESGPVIKAGSVLIFDLELLEIVK